MHVALLIAAALILPAKPAKSARKPKKTAPQHTFEELARGAMVLNNVEKAVGPFLQTCGKSNDLPDIQCRAIRGFMQRRASRRTYLTNARPDALHFGEYDSAKFVYPVTVMGCISCTEPIAFDPVLFRPNRFYVTTRQPKSIRDGRPEGLELAKFELPVDPRKVGQWMKKVKPYLRVQFLYRVTPDGVWPNRLGHGFTLHMGGFRVYNRCTGEVLYSQPPSKGPGPVDRTGCEQKKVQKKVTENLPKKLSSSKILSVMQSIRKDLKKCYEMYQIPGRSTLMIKVRGTDGKVIQVRTKGAFSGTPTGQCLEDTVKKALFPRFSRKFQEFRYPVTLP